MLKKIIIIVSTVSFLFVLLVVPCFASGVVPGDNYQQDVYESFPCLDTTYFWYGLGNAGTPDNAVLNFASSQKITGNWEFFKQNANGFNTQHRFGGTSSYVTRYLRDRGGSNLWLQWYESFTGIIPSTFGMRCRDFITPPYENGVRDLECLPVFYFIFNGNTSLENSYFDFHLACEFTVYDNDYLGNNLAMNEIIRVTPVSMNVSGTQKSVFVVDLNEIIENHFGDKYSSLYGINWKYFYFDMRSGVVDDYNFDAVQNMVIITQTHYNRGIPINQRSYYDELVNRKFYNEGFEDGENALMFIPTFLQKTVEPFFSFEIFPNFSIGGLLSIIIGVLCVLWILKLIAGG